MLGPVRFSPDIPGAYSRHLLIFNNLSALEPVILRGRAVQPSLTFRSAEYANGHSQPAGILSLATTSSLEFGTPTDSLDNWCHEPTPTLGMNKTRRTQPAGLPAPPPGLWPAAAAAWQRAASRAFKDASIRLRPDQASEGLPDSPMGFNPLNNLLGLEDEQEAWEEPHLLVLSPPLILTNEGDTDREPGAESGPASPGLSRTPRSGTNSAPGLSRTFVSLEARAAGGSGDSGDRGPWMLQSGWGGAGAKGGGRTLPGLYANQPDSTLLDRQFWAPLGGRVSVYREKIVHSDYLGFPNNPKDERDLGQQGGELLILAVRPDFTHKDWTFYLRATEGPSSPSPDTPGASAESGGPEADTGAFACVRVTVHLPTTSLRRCRAQALAVSLFNAAAVSVVRREKELASFKSGGTGGAPQGEWAYAWRRHDTSARMLLVTACIALVFAALSTKDARAEARRVFPPALSAASGLSGLTPGSGLSVARAGAVFCALECPSILTAIAAMAAALDAAFRTGNGGEEGGAGSGSCLYLRHRLRIGARARRLNAQVSRRRRFRLHLALRPDVHSRSWC